VDDCIEDKVKLPVFTQWIHTGGAEV